MYDKKLYVMFPIKRDEEAFEITDAEGHKLFDIRGWGRLTGGGHGALGLSEKDGKAAQVARADYVITATNSHRAMVEALKGVIRVADRKTAEFDAAKAALREAGEEA